MCVCLCICVCDAQRVCITHAGLHFAMFMPTLAATGTPAQIAEWMPRALAPSIIGCFAQTELAHGSNVRALETTATHDPRTHEFELNTPSLGATKFWPGGLGNTSTHAVVMAQLVTADGGRHGVHGFIVPLRSPVDHTPLPGVSVGDIGPKMGYHDNDNGFLFLSHVRIPGAHMLARHARVTPAGVFERLAGAHAKGEYAALIDMRARIVVGAASVLARALTIAVRYSAVRRQFAPDGGASEVQILDYQTQQFKLLPLLATAYVLAAAARPSRLFVCVCVFAFCICVCVLHVCASGYRYVAPCVLRSLLTLADTRFRQPALTWTGSTSGC